MNAKNAQTICSQKDKDRVWYVFCIPCKSKELVLYKKLRINNLHIE
jgi:hypothetical protein